LALLDKLFDYCERGSDPAFWAEPVNALTNVGFLLAGGYAICRALAIEPRRPERALGLALGALVMVIGTGSFLFHTFATGLAKLADVIPIMVFMLAYLGVALRVLLGLRWLAVGALLIAFFAALMLAERIPCRGLLSIVDAARGRCLNGTIGYLPAWLALLAVGATLRLRGHAAARPMLLAAAVFAVSMLFRSLDRALCPTWSYGTHSLWHLLNATTLFLLLKAVVDIPAGRRDREASTHDRRVRP